MTADDTDARPMSSPEPPSPPPRRGRVGIFAAVALIVLALDVVSKVLVAGKLPESRPPLRILGGAIYLDQARNSGAAFSLGTGFTVILTVVALVVVVIIARTARRMRSIGWAIALGLVFGGALGNLADRVFRSPGVGRGRVVDWISLFGPYGSHWPIFNLADSGIVCGAILAAILVVCGVDFDGRASRPTRGEKSAGGTPTDGEQPRHPTDDGE